MRFTQPIIAAITAILFGLFFTLAANAAVENGAMAPGIFTNDTNGADFSLDAYKGKIVVLEWKNHKCPFVEKHYKSGNMQGLQKELTAKDVVWVSIISSAEGKQGHVSAEEANAIAAEEGSAASHIILDPAGAIGKQYGAKTTPHMFVINAEGKIVYQGAIDSIKSADPADIAEADNYVKSAVEALMAEQPIEVASSTPYGCSVKY